MNTQEYDLTKFNEECSEVIKEICKAQRFGLDDTNPITKATNREAIQEELYDLVYIADKMGFSLILSDYGFAVRHEKYMTWKKYSKDRGVINESGT